MGIKIQLRRDTASNWTSINPVLKSGELGIETDTLKFKIGNGTAAWNSLISYAMRPGEPNGVATLNSSGKIPVGQLPNSVSITQEVQNAVGLLSLTTSNIAEGTNQYFTNQRAINATSTLITNAISTSESYTDGKINLEISNRDTAILSAKTEAINTAETYALGLMNNAISVANTATTNQINTLSATLPGLVNTAIASPIASEVSARNSAISTAINNEITSRNTAITNAIAQIPTTNFSSKTTNDLTEGSTNKYFTDARAKAAVASDITAAINGANISLSSKTTNDLAEGSSNLYFTISRARAAAAYPLGQLSDSINSAFEDVYLQVGSINNQVNSIQNNIDTTSLTNADLYVANGVAGLDSTVHVPDQYIPSTIARLVNTQLTGSTTAENISTINATISGNLTVNGTTTTINATNLSISDPLIYMAQGNSANANDIGIVGHATISGTYQHLGLVRDHSDGKWKLFSGVTTEPGSSTIDFGSATWDTLKVGRLEGNVTGSLTGNADTVTNGVYTSNSYSDPSWLTLSKSKIGLSNVDNTTDLNKPISTATSAALLLKAPLNNPTFTGNINLSNTAINFSGATIIGMTTLPVQINNSGKYLTTDGTQASWTTLDLSSYLVSSIAASTYLTQSNATSTYLTKSMATSTYATLSNAQTYGYHNSSSGTVANRIAYGSSITPSITSPIAGDIYIQY